MDNIISFLIAKFDCQRSNAMSTQFLQYDSGQIAYDDVGSGPLVVCVPSMGDVRGEYRFLAPRLVVAGFRVVTMDVRGHGESSTHWPDFSVAAIGSDLVALIRALDGGPATIIGASMAAGAAVWAAAEAPDLVAGLVLIGPFVRGGGSAITNLLWATLFARPWGPAVWQWYYAKLYPAQKPADFAQYSAGLRANLQEPGRLEALQQMLYASKAASEARLPAVTQPALVLMGSKDPDFKQPEAEAKWVAEQVRGDYQMIEHAGHYPHTELPDATAPLILAFLQARSERMELADGAQIPA
jgi:pimeloyl-ACP methyl ester carboxylesterase